MKDPLHYFLQEGFGNIYAFSIGENMFEARLRWAKQYSDFIPTIMNDGKNTYIKLRGVNYVVTADFMRRYAKIVDSEEEADKLIFEENAEWELLSAELFNSKTS